jgi:hypothetical protein
MQNRVPALIRNNPGALNMDLIEKAVTFRQLFVRSQVFLFSQSLRASSMAALRSPFLPPSLFTTSNLPKALTAFLLAEFPLRQ